MPKKRGGKRGNKRDERKAVRVRSDSPSPKTILLAILAVLAMTSIALLASTGSGVMGLFAGVARRPDKPIEDAPSTDTKTTKMGPVTAVYNADGRVTFSPESEDNKMRLAQAVQFAIDEKRLRPDSVDTFEFRADDGSVGNALGVALQAEYEEGITKILSWNPDPNGMIGGEYYIIHCARNHLRQSVNLLAKEPRIPLITKVAAMGLAYHRGDKRMVRDMLRADRSIAHAQVELDVGTPLTFFINDLQFMQRLARSKLVDFSKSPDVLLAAVENKVGSETIIWLIEQGAASCCGDEVLKKLEPESLEELVLRQHLGIVDSHEERMAALPVYDSTLRLNSAFADVTSGFQVENGSVVPIGG